MHKYIKAIILAQFDANLKNIKCCLNLHQDVIRFMIVRKADILLNQQYVFIVMPHCGTQQCGPVPYTTLLPGS